SALIVGSGAEREREAVRDHLVTEPGHLCSERQGGLANVVHCCKEDRKPARLLGIPHRNLDDAPSLLTHPPVPEQLCRISRVCEMLVEWKPTSQLATLVDPALGPYSSGRHSRARPVPLHSEHGPGSVPRVQSRRPSPK